MVEHGGCISNRLDSFVDNLNLSFCLFYMFVSPVTSNVDGWFDGVAALKVNKSNTMDCFVEVDLKILEF